MSLDLERSSSVFEKIELNEILDLVPRVTRPVRIKPYDKLKYGFLGILFLTKSRGLKVNIGMPGSTSIITCSFDEKLGRAFKNF